LVVNKGSTCRTEVINEEFPIFISDLGMVSGNEVIIDYEVIIQLPPDEDNSLIQGVNLFFNDNIDKLRLLFRRRFKFTHS
jgi:hypothetical protein